MGSEPAKASDSAKAGAFAPLAEPTFRRIWISSLFSNFGQLILGVGAAWEMTRMTHGAPGMVALVQSALMLPSMLVAVPAGALADMFDRRRIALTGLGFAALSGAVLTVLASLALVTPWVLLGFVVLIGGGVALYSPSWQASIGEQVSDAHLPAAISLGSISYNVARSFGPALGGVIVMAAGAKVAFGINAVFYLPLWIAFFFWRRRHAPSRLPPERIARAIISGARYARHSPPIRTVLLRALAFGLASATYTALGPLIAKTLLHGDAATYGVLLGATGIGAVSGAVYLTKMRRLMSNEALVRIFVCLTAGSLLTLSVSRSVWISGLAFFVIGISNMQCASLFNIGVQLTAPRWVTARALSLYSSFLTGGIAIGAWFWGTIATHFGVAVALAASGCVVAGTALLGLVLPLPREEEIDTDAVHFGREPEVELALTMRSGPVVIEVEYDVDPAQARAFYEAAQRLQKLRHRNGGFDWSLARDIADPALWIERWHCPTWGDYLRMRDRYTQGDLDIQALANGFDRVGPGRKVRRWLERPYGSVRWKAETPDPKTAPVGFLGP
ncbi:MAG: MFS transporter [Sphingomonadales bacterium]|nr:MFS transporter [Sphingomonadales bacterium]